MRLCLKLRLEIALKRALGSNELYVSPILEHLLLLLELHVFLLGNARETPLLGHNDLLSSRELVTSTSESFHYYRGVGILAADGENDLADIDTGDSAVWLTPCTAHAGLKPISSGTGQHLVDTNNVERMNADSQMERILASSLGDVFVGTDTSSFESLT